LPADPIETRLGELSIVFGSDAILISGPGPRPGELELPGDADAVRTHVRFDAMGRYRPLPGAYGLRQNWHARFATLDAAAAAIDAVYPLAQAHIADFEAGALRVVTLDHTLGRQAGRYALAASLSERGRRACSATLCGVCVKLPVWRDGRPPELPEGAIPCPEPCSVLVSLCREAALWERERPPAARPDADVPFAAFDTPGNVLREHLLAHTMGVDG
jgi:hypothetical protein